jgi:hypothetical protein
MSVAAMPDRREGQRSLHGTLSQQDRLATVLAQSHETENRQGEDTSSQLNGFKLVPSCSITMLGAAKPRDAHQEAMQWFPLTTR